ncbi:MAG TPA: formate dehydrogenase accessory sulfurtransferase FdhD, partial [Thermoanaerobaculia bacterium]|nr:formate dehydrogenase accessory sulfurtransferase FdhD [Thermoanaerobaculia bacterium]
MEDTHRDASVSTLVLRSDEKGTRWAKDSLVAEEPLEIRLREGGAEPERFVVTMRTPGDDDDLVVGLLFGEGVIEKIGEITAIEPPADTRIAPELAKNVRVIT